MKKILLLTALIAITFAANSTIYYFGSTTANLTTSSFNITNLTSVTATDSMLVNYDYGDNNTYGTASSISYTTCPNVVFGFTNSGVKTSFFRVYPYAFYTSGKGVTVTISNVNVGDSIILATQAKGSTSDIWTITSGATTSSNLTISGAPTAPAINPVSYIRLQATDVTVVIKETNGGFRLLSMNEFNSTSAVRSILADKGITFNGTEITNSQNLNIELYSVLGKRVATANTSISTSNLPKGVYIVRVKGSTDALKISL